MTTKSVTRSLVAVGLLAAGALAGWFMRARADSEPKIALESTASQNPNSAISISTSTVASRKLKRHIDAVGSVHAYEDLVIAAKSEAESEHPNAPSSGGGRNMKAVMYPPIDASVVFVRVTSSWPELPPR